MLDRFFHFRENNTDVKTETLAGATTFLTMAYIIFVNPQILAVAGMPLGPTMAATCLAAAIPTLLMGLWANYPFALAPGMGLNAFLAYTIVKGKGLTWESAQALIVLEGLLITILVLTKFRQQVMNSIPLPLKKAIGAGIGLFIAFLGLTHAGFIEGNAATLIGTGNFRDFNTQLALIGLVITVFLVAWGVRGSLLWGILITTGVSLSLGNKTIPAVWVSLPSFETVGGFSRGLEPVLKLSMISLILAVMLSDFFDTMGTIIAVGGKGKFLQSQGGLPRLNRVLLVDSVAAALGGFFGASSSTTYIESASGVASGGRTGFASVVTGRLFILCLFFSPIVSLVPKEATAPALIMVGFSMMSMLTEISWSRIEEGFPAFLTVTMIPFTSSIADGIGWGVISYVILQVVKGRGRQLGIPIVIMFLLFAYSLSPWGR